MSKGQLTQEERLGLKPMPTDEQLKDRFYESTLTAYRKGKTVHTLKLYRIEGAAPLNVPMKLIEAAGLRDFAERKRTYRVKWGLILSKENLESALRLGLLSGVVIFAQVQVSEKDAK